MTLGNVASVRKLAVTAASVKNPRRGYSPLHHMIREAEESDLQTCIAFRTKLWPNCVGEENEREVIAILRSPKHRALLAFDGVGKPRGYLELSLRNYADGCASSPVGYIEGVFVEETHRKQGIGRLLIDEGIRWCDRQGCSEVASDALLENQESIDFHAKIGFEEVERHVVFRKEIRPKPGR